MHYEVLGQLGEGKTIDKFSVISVVVIDGFKEKHNNLIIVNKNDNQLSVCNELLLIQIRQLISRSEANVSQKKSFFHVSA